MSEYDIVGNETPAGFAVFPKEINLPPREWAEHSLRIQRWTQMPRGGHFAALEEPELLVEELRAFFRPLRENAPIEIEKDTNFS